MKTVIKYMKPYLFSVIFCLCLKGVAAIFELLIPRMLAVIIDEDVPRGDLSAVLRNGGIMLSFALLTFIFNVIGNRLSAHATGKIANGLRHDLFEKTIRLDVEKTDRFGLSSLTSRLTSDTYNITNFLARMQRIGIRAPMMLIGGIAITLTIDVKLALVLIAILPLVSMTVYFITKRSIPIYNEEHAILDKLIRRVDETASGIRVIKALSKVEYEKKRFHEVSDELSEKEINAGRLTSLTKPINDFIFYMGLCLVILVSALTTKDGEATAGKLLAFMTYFTIILNNMIMMSRVFVQTSRAFSSASRIEAVLLSDTNMQVVDSAPSSSNDFIVFDNVSFSYNKKATSIKNVSFSLGRGETLGIIGATGSGKTTLVNLLLRLYDVDEGGIYIGGRNVKSIPKDELYSMFGVAFQNDFLFRGNLRENIEFHREISDDELDNSLKISQAEEFVLAEEKGIQREVTTGGTNLSGGQKQRTLIARAVLGNPDIIILDDSSSALDYKTDLKLRRSIKESLKTTTVIVSQRIASIMSADKIIVIDEGKIVGIGKHGELLETCDMYKQIANVQFC